MRLKTFEGRLAVAASTTDMEDLVGVVKGLGVFFEETKPLMVFAGTTQGMTMFGDLLLKQIPQVETIHIKSLLDPNPLNSEERSELVELILSEVGNNAPGLLVIAPLIMTGYLGEWLHAKGQRDYPIAPGFAAGMDKDGKRFLIRPDGSVSRNI